MFTIRKIIKLTIATTAISVASMSFSSGYLGGSISRVDLEFEDVPAADVSPTALNIRIGNKFNENIAAEARIGIGLNGDSDSFGDETDIERSLGVYLKVGSQLSESIYPYFIVGKTDATLKSLGQKDSEQDTSIGFGFDFNQSDSTSFTVEYIRYMEFEGLNVSGFSVGFTTKL